MKYDLLHILRSNWPTLGPKVAHKLNVYVGDMDSFYLNNAVERLNAFLAKADNPKFTGEVVFERRAPHCWGPSAAESAAEDDGADRARGACRGGFEGVEIPLGGGAYREPGTGIRDSAKAGLPAKFVRRQGGPPSPKLRRAAFPAFTSEG